MNTIKAMQTANFCFLFFIFLKPSRGMSPSYVIFFSSTLFFVFFFNLIILWFFMYFLKSNFRT